MPKGNEQSIASMGGLRPKRAAEFCDVSRSTIYKWVAERKLPPPVKISSRVALFRIEDLRRLMAATAGERGAA